jgi:hypothetical protein
MIKIAHRINTVKLLASVPTNFGIEVDVRYHNNDLILHHDPFNHQLDPTPELLESLLKEYNCTGPLILNIKTEGIEKLCISLMAKYDIQNWFFLDLSMPYFAVFAEHAKNNTIPNFTSNNLATRFSEREHINYALGFKGSVKWVWVDCFTKQPLNEDYYKQLKDAGFKICLVSPELQKHPVDWIDNFKKTLKDLPIDAVCTKHPDLWS